MSPNQWERTAHNGRHFYRRVPGGRWERWTDGDRSTFQLRAVPDHLVARFTTEAIRRLKRRWSDAT